MAKMLTLKEAAGRLGLHLNTVRKYVDRGMIPIIKYEKAVRIEEKDLEAFIEVRKERKGTKK